MDCGFRRSDSSLVGSQPQARRQLRRQRPLSAPISRGDSHILPSQSGRAHANNHQRQQQQQRRRRRPASSGRCRNDEGATAGGLGRDGSWGGGWGGGALEDKFGCLQARLAKTVESSSNFVGDIRRLRKAGGLDANARDPAAATAAWGRKTAAVAERESFGSRIGGQAITVDGGRGSPTTAALAAIPAEAGSAAEIEPLALAKELGVQAIVNRITHAIMHDRTANIGGCGARGAGGGKGGCSGAGKTGFYRSGTLFDENNAGTSGAPCSPTQQYRHQHRQPGLSPPQSRRAGATTSPPRASLSSSQASPGKKERPKEDVDRLRRVVRDTMSSTTQKPSPASPLPPRGGGVSPGGERGGTHTPQWSQKHEACLAGLRRMLRATGSPLIRAKDPAILVGALLRRQGPVIKRLDDAVVSLQETAEALDALVSMSSRLRIADVSADGLFTRAGVVKDGDGGGLGSAPTTTTTISNNTRENNGYVTGVRGSSPKARAGERASPAARRCTVKRVHVEIHRVLGDVASYREFKIALVACARGRGRGDEGDSGGAAMEWTSLDQLDHALRTCHLTRRALDPQGASHPPLTGKRVTRFLEGMKASRHTQPAQAPAVIAATTAAGQSSNAVSVLLAKGNSTTQSCGASKRDAAWSRGGAASAGQSRGRRRRAAAGRKRAGKWNDDDRDLAERELAAVILLDQERFVEGYVRERKRYLNRRVSAQREGHAGFKREEGVAGGAGGRSKKAATEAQKAEFAEAVNRTKIVLKLLEAKRAAAGVPPPEEATQGPGQEKSGQAGKPSSVTAGTGGAKARRDYRRPAAATTNSVRHTFSPQKEVDRRKSGAAQGDGKHEKRSMKKVLRASTEAYSDRVDREGGGAAKASTRSSPWGKGRATGPGGMPGNSSTAGGAAVGGGGERAMMSAAAITVQVAFRQRMFHRFVWAQAYLRSPAHAYGVFTRCFPVSRSGGNGSSGAASGLVPPHVGDATRSNASTTPTTALTFPQLTGATTIEAFDAAFMGYVRWRRKEGPKSSLPDAPSVDRTTEAPHPPVAGASMVPGGAEATTLSSPGSPSFHPSQAQNEQQRGQQHEEQRPEGAQLFERKHVIRTAAVRSVLVDLRVPFLPGALEAAVEDLERTIARETARSAALTASSSHGNKPQSYSGGRNPTPMIEMAVVLSPTKGKASRESAAVSGRPERSHHGSGLSFVEWYLWWTRHLPFDPASTGCLLKTIRCAKALRAAEITAAEGRS